MLEFAADEDVEVALVNGAALTATAKYDLQDNGLMLEVVGNADDGNKLVFVPWANVMSVTQQQPLEAKQEDRIADLEAQLAAAKAGKAAKDPAAAKDSEVAK